MTLNRHLSVYRNCSAEAVSSGSRAQAIHFVTDAAHRSNLIRYAVECPAGTFDGEAYDDEPHAEAVAMERLMSAVCASLPQTQTEAA